MTKSKYYVVTFPANSLKNPLATLAGNVIGSIDRVFEIFALYSEETYGKSPLQILQKTLKNESLFDPEVLGLIPSDNNEVTQAPLMKSPDTESHGLETAGTGDVKMDISSDKDTEMEVSTTNGSEMEVDTTKDVKMEISTAKAAEIENGTAESDENKTKVIKKESKEPEIEERIKDLVRRNLVKIKSMSVIKESKSIGIELNMDLSFGISKYLDTKGETKNKSPLSSPSKPSITFQVSEESPLLSVDYSDSKFLEFLAKRLSSILSSRKIYTDQICNCFQSFLKHVRELNNTIGNISFVVENLPMAKEAYLTDELLKMRADLLNKALEMSGKMEPLLKNSEINVAVSERSSKEIVALEKEQGPILSTEGESDLAIDDLKRFEAALKEICKEIDARVVFEDRMWRNLFPLYSDFEWLIKHFIKFLIITGVLEHRK